MAKRVHLWDGRSTACDKATLPLLGDSTTIDSEECNCVECLWKVSAVLHAQVAAVMRRLRTVTDAQRVQVINPTKKKEV
jgi:hypothetical protein